MKNGSRFPIMSDRGNGTGRFCEASDCFTDRIVFRSKIGNIRLLGCRSMLVSLAFTDESPGEPDGCSPMLSDAREQILSYLDGRLYNFDIPLHLEGTDFSNAVWRELQSIPYGTVRTYADIAKGIGNTKAFRAVGNAVHANPLPIVVPCHRVVRSDGRPGGYAWGEERKAFLLGLEQKGGNLIHKRNSGNDVKS